MSLLAIHDQERLTVADFVLLQTPFTSAVNALLPVPASVSFGAYQAGALLPSLSDKGVFPSLDLTMGEPPSQATVYHDTLVIPLSMGEGEGVGVVATGVDPSLLKKFSNHWLRDFQAQVFRQLLLVRKVHTDPDSGMYNRRALHLVPSLSGIAEVSLLFLAVGFASRSAAMGATRLQQVTDLLHAVMPGLFFSLGPQLFGLLLFDTSAAKSLQVCRLLQKHLKRDGVRRVQVGIASGEQKNEVVEGAWRGLVEAEKRGPFGVCDTRALADQPFTVADAAVLKQLRREWRGCLRFTLVIFAWGDFSGTAREMERGLQHLLADVSPVLISEPGHTYAFFPALEEGYPAQLADLLGLLGDRLVKQGIEAVGIAGWPMLDFSKTQTAFNCHKALLHCSFLEPGSVTVFDHLSLNISGDYYFDRGDYHAASRDYRDGLRLRPDDINLLNSLGVTLVEFNRYARAVECFSAVLKQEPADYMALVNLGLAQLAGGKKIKAIEALEQARQVIPDLQAGAELFLPLGRLYTEYGQTALAVAVLQQWATLPGSDREYLLHRLLGKNYFEQAEYKQAISACQRALRIYPQDAVSLSLLGLLYVIEGQGDDIGLRLCAQAVELDPANPDNHYRQALALFQAGKVAQARETAGHCLRLQRKHVDCGMLVARIELLEGYTIRAGGRLKRLQRRPALTHRQQREIERMLVSISTGGVEGGDL